MNKNDKSANYSMHGGDYLVIKSQTLRRLDLIKKDDESCDETLDRVLGLAVQEVPVKDILTALLSEFEDAVNIHVELMPQCEDPTLLAELRR